MTEHDPQVYISSGNGSHWHVTPLCSRLLVKADWETMPFGLVWDAGLRCCTLCAKKAYRGELYRQTPGERR